MECLCWHDGNRLHLCMQHASGGEQYTELAELRAENERLRAELQAAQMPEPLASFVAVMREKLRENEHKGGWRCEAKAALFARLVEEVDELRECMELGLGPRFTAREAADVANFAMMIADVSDGIDARKDVK